MCGIVGVVSNSPVNQLLYDALLLLQHRGQDAAGIATGHGNKFAMHKANGLVRDVFRTRNMRSLPGNIGIGQVRYPTAGSTSEEEAQPFYVNAPFGIVLAHNGNLTNADELKIELFKNDMRHLNTDSDSEVLLNILAHQIQEVTSGYSLDPQSMFRAVSMLHRRVRGSYAVVAQIAGYGLLAFRDPFGIRPLCIGLSHTENGVEYMIASESVALDGLGFKFLRDVEPGEAIFIDLDGKMYNEQCADNPTLNPCAFEYVYLARPDSIIDGASVYLTRLKMGEYLADKVRNQFRDGEIDVVMPIPDSSRPSAMELAMKLNLDYREGFIKNRYIGRTFMMPGQAIRRKSVRQKLNAIKQEFAGKSVLLVDDSIVRGTTSREIVQMARESGAKRVIFASAAPPVKFPNVYGIDMPTRSELIAYGRSEDEVCREITADALVYQDVAAMKRSISDVNPYLRNIEASCFDGYYVTGDVSPAYLNRLETARNNPRPDTEDVMRSQLNLNLAERAD
ncbi:amidophosphoribosyltransferase [Undibacterium sp. 5I1]|uniref:amidophosphoribosyltransferase n=1 Tax=unclassified Undibacterium TaxID=2630295 RepID=UPI002AB5187F|nr:MULTISPECIES: amidophosphoribosyltransferase [unclassified Undibacterium]MDY7538203.1 amidophosphoribosyltransferase [Undibacterium sp. 5I1]MEB0229606.1 amidophosphoribosyltransferase [Undibacterium sp. 10I3]MEB0257315.1 amidophosphoribosyltransferase [Undibacterium sp. 5I1]